MNISDLQNKIDIPYERDKELEHNVKILLSLYRKVNFRVEERIQNLELETYESRRKHLEELVISILEMDATMNYEKFEDQLISINESLFLLQIMDKALERLKNYPDNGKLYGTILELRFFVKEIYSHDIIMDKVNMSRSSYYRHLPRAIQSYGLMLFGYALPEVRTLIYDENVDINNLKVAEEKDKDYMSIRWNEMKLELIWNLNDT